MRWKRGDEYVEIRGGVSADGHQNVWYVDTNPGFDWGALPIECRRQIPKSDEAGYRELVEVISKWTESEGYRLDSEDTIT